MLRAVHFFIIALYCTATSQSAVAQRLAAIKNPPFLQANAAVAAAAKFACECVWAVMTAGQHRIFADVDVLCTAAVCRDFLDCFVFVQGLPITRQNQCDINFSIFYGCHS